MIPSGTFVGKWGRRISGRIGLAVIELGLVGRARADGRAKTEPGRGGRADRAQPPCLSCRGKAWRGSRMHPWSPAVVALGLSLPVAIASDCDDLDTMIR